MKRVFDIVAATLLMIGASPLFCAIALLVRWHLGSPIIFWQLRPGLGGKPFKMFKFRTMLEAYDDEGQPLPDAIRLTTLGRLLRASSLDELPELVNVIRGDMSFVGPRPLLMEYLPLYTPEQARRHEVRPGITGLAQVSGRNAISWERKFALDVQYVDQRSFMLDLKLLAVTVIKVLMREGIDEADAVGQTKFKGSE